MPVTEDSTGAPLWLQSAARWLVLLAPTLADGLPDMADARAFLAGPEDAICIHRDVWHAGLTVFDCPAEFGMMMWRADAGDVGELQVDKADLLALDQVGDPLDGGGQSFLGVLQGANDHILLLVHESHDLACGHLVETIGAGVANFGGHEGSGD